MGGERKYRYTQDYWMKQYILPDRWRLLLFGEYRKRIPVRVMTDSEPTLESIASTRQIERKGLRMTVQEMKEKLMEGEIKLYQWLSTKDMWADGLTKEMEMAEGLR